MLTSCCWHLLYFQFDSAALADCFGTQIHERPDVTNSAPLSREFRGRIWWSFLEKCMYLSFWRYCECIKKNSLVKKISGKTTHRSSPFLRLGLGLCRPDPRLEGPSAEFQTCQDKPRRKSKPNDVWHLPLSPPYYPHKTQKRPIYSAYYMDIPRQAALAVATVATSYFELT